MELMEAVFIWGGVLFLLPVLAGCALHVTGYWPQRHED